MGTRLHYIHRQGMLSTNMARITSCWLLVKSFPNQQSIVTGDMLCKCTSNNCNVWGFCHVRLHCMMAFTIKSTCCYGKANVSLRQSYLEMLRLLVNYWGRQSKGTLQLISGSFIPHVHFTVNSLHLHGQVSQIRWSARHIPSKLTSGMQCWHKES